MTDRMSGLPLTSSLADQIFPTFNAGTDTSHYNAFALIERHPRASSELVQPATREQQTQFHTDAGGNG
jgi:hypothetical protein